MKIPTFLLVIISNVFVYNSCFGQRTIIYDKKGRLVTTDTSKGITYLGSPYLGDIVWHQGYLIYRNQQEVPAQIAYNIVFDQIYWRLNDSTDVVQALPDEFTFEGRRFIADQYKVVKVKRVTYFEVLYDGKTKLVRRWTKRLRPIDWKLYTSRVLPEDRFAAEYILTGDLYIQKEGERPKFIIPTEYSLSRFLPSMGSDFANFIASHELTDQVLVEALIQYDKRLVSLTH
ncbi:hypothetical protein GCM10028808_03020 [Spirosoma migulaei]